MNYKAQVKIGQCWRRKKNKVLVKITDERDGMFKCVPVVKGSGRASWKWVGGIVSEMVLVDEAADADLITAIDRLGGPI